MSRSNPGGQDPKGESESTEEQTVRGHGQLHRKTQACSEDMGEATSRLMQACDTQRQDTGQTFACHRTEKDRGQGSKNGCQVAGLGSWEPRLAHTQVLEHPSYP